MYKIAVLPGDGIGTEVVPQAVLVIKAVSEKFDCSFEMREGLIGGSALEKTGSALPQETQDIIAGSQAILFGAMGGTKWDRDPRMAQGSLLALRKSLGAFANIRPAYLYQALENASPLKRELVSGTDILVVRENTGGLYFGEKKREEGENGPRAFDTMVYSHREVERVARMAFELARNRRKKLTSVDKANVLMWREVVIEVSKSFPDVELEHLYVDNCAMQIVRAPRQFDVIVTENTFGDILSDEAAMVVGSLGLMPSASIGGKIGLYEPVHGSAPDIAGQDKANPIAAILSAAMLLRYSFNLNAEAQAIEKAVGKVLDLGYRTADIMEDGCRLVGTREMGNLIAREITVKG